MDISELKLGANATNAVLALTMKVELACNVRIRAARSLKDLVSLLQQAQMTDHPEVRSTLDSLKLLLNPRQIAMLWAHGVDLATGAKSPGIIQRG